MMEFFRSVTEALGTLLAFLYDIVGNYGLAIILLTIAVRVVMLPLTIKQTRSMQGMQKIQPQLKALQQKHKGDRQKLNEEVMKLYKEHQVNPLGGCLPLLLQLPVFLMLYQVLQAGGGTRYLPDGSALALAIKAHSAPFLGMNLACSPLKAGQGVAPLAGDCGNGILAAVPFFVLVALMVFTTYYQSKQMQASSGAQAAQQQMMMRIMPAFLGFISLQIPAGVLLYWVTTNVWQVGQQGVMLKMKARVEASPPGKPVAGSPPGKAATAPAPRTQPPKSSGRKGPHAGSRKKRRKR